MSIKPQSTRHSTVRTDSFDGSHKVLAGQSLGRWDSPKKAVRYSAPGWSQQVLVLVLDPEPPIDPSFCTQPGDLLQSQTHQIHVKAHLTCPGSGRVPFFYGQIWMGISPYNHESALYSHGKLGKKGCWAVLL